MLKTGTEDTRGTVARYQRDSHVEKTCLKEVNKIYVS